MREKAAEWAARLFEPLPCFVRHYSEECVCTVQQIDPSAYRIGQGGGNCTLLTNYSDDKHELYKTHLYIYRKAYFATSQTRRYSQYSTGTVRYDTDIMIAIWFTISGNYVFLHPDNKICRPGHLCSIEILHFKLAILWFRYHFN